LSGNAKRFLQKQAIHLTERVFLLAIAPSTRGFGFALLEGLDMLVNWGDKRVKGDKNRNSLAKVEDLIAQYQPDVLVLQDNSTKPFRRAARIRALSRQIIRVAGTRKVSVALFSHEQVRRVFFADGQGTKHALAEIIANKFPEELGFRLPPKRRAWMSEDSRMDIFDAVALVLMLRRRKAKRTAPKIGV
jgi:Holliday junction resolvasome RuvABC endonuclease subunit